MIYQMLQAGQDALSPWRLQARGWAGILSQMPARHPAFDAAHALRGTLETFGHAGCILRDAAGTCTGGFDPRSDGAVAAY